MIQKIVVVTIYSFIIHLFQYLTAFLELATITTENSFEKCLSRILLGKTFSFTLLCAVMTNSIISIIDSDKLEGERTIVAVEEISIRFKEKFQARPDFIVRSPGRINLIGDHIDYHGFSVLPMAIECSVLLACRTYRSLSDKGKVRIANVNSDSYVDWQGEHSLHYGGRLDESHKWFHYVLCGYHGVLAQRLLSIEPSAVLENAKSLNKKPIGSGDSEHNELSKIGHFDALVGGDLPPASGLSSSSALVCASAVATSLILDESCKQRPEISRQRLAESCSKIEHLIGTNGGGMDQAVIMTAQKGYAKHVNFVPIFKTENVHLPTNVIWLVSHCGLEFPKAATTSFNARVLETKIGAAMMAKLCDIEHQIPLDKSITLREVKEKLYSTKSTQEIVKLIKDKIFNKKPEYSVEEICAVLEMTIDELIDRFNTSREFVDCHKIFKPLSRCVHVFEEAERVRKFRSICDATGDIKSLGQLMTESHYSLRDNYECSHPALDKLVEVALDAGAAGSRLTGAGWGGCIVTLVGSDRCEIVARRLEEVSKFTFKTEPQAGTEIIRMVRQ